ncbi:MAG: helix-turn-helix domain-containing protein [Burkholderiales bacterium]
MNPENKSEARETRTNGVEPAQIWRSRNFIREHLGEKLSLTQIAKAAHISPTYLSEEFKEVTGENLVRYIARSRVERAEALLQNGAQRISEIAFAVGFQSLSQFNRVFKKLRGKTPTQFRDERKTSA